jgi:hypothetical protein
VIRPRGSPASVVVGFLFAVAAAVWGSAFLIHTAPSVRSAPIALADRVSRLGPVPAISPARPLPMFARVAGIHLRVVSGEALGVAFHEASRPDALKMHPFGRCVVCGNRTKFSPARSDGAEVDYTVMDPRGRPAPATSAVDMALPEGALVRSPVTGTVTGVTRYRLYGRYWDARVEIRPDEEPRHRVVIIHLMAVTLERGDPVKASGTVLGVVRSFPFDSQVDRYVPGRHPHVHLEVKRPAPGRAVTEP